jgi:hypothetical protein
MVGNLVPSGSQALACPEPGFAVFLGAQEQSAERFPPGRVQRLLLVAEMLALPRADTNRRSMLSHAASCLALGIS